MCRLSETETFRVKFSLSCLSIRVVACETTASLYFWHPPSLDSAMPNQWTLAQSRVPALVTSFADYGRIPKGVYLNLADRDTGFSTWRETLTTSSNYRAQSTFHTLILSNGGGAMAGFRFHNEEAGNVFHIALKEAITVAATPELKGKARAKDKGRTKQFPKLKKVEISTPCGFQHVTSIPAAGESFTGCSYEEKGRRKSLTVPGRIRRAFSMYTLS